MKFIIPWLSAVFSLSAPAQPVASTRHLFIITIDGFRWQEVFTGADPLLVGNEAYVRDTALTRQMYWDSSGEARRKKLLPFFWGTIAEKGRLYGNRLLGNKVNVRNFYKISYPGYNEIFTGHTDAISSPNLAIPNKNVNVLEYLNQYDLYLQQAADIDRMIADLWYMVQTDPFYKDNTTFLITTDHGRGWKPNKWMTHGFWAQGSGDIWMAVLGPDIRPEGELRTRGQVFQKQIAATISSLLGDPRGPGHPPGKAIVLPARQPAAFPEGIALAGQGR